LTVIKSNNRNYSICSLLVRDVIEFGVSARTFQKILLLPLSTNLKCR